MIPLILLSLGCHSRRPVDYGLPTLPAPVGDLYVSVPAAPPDGLVAAVLDGAGLPPWNETLGAAAAGLGLWATIQGEAPDMAAARWSAIRAGWPFPVDFVGVEMVAAGERPAGLLADLGQAAAPGHALGLVRVRGQEGDLWVGLLSPTPTRLAPFPRESAVDATLTLPLPGVGWTDPVWRALSPDLSRREGAELTLDRAGEWVVELTATDPVGARRVLVQVPLYVGEPTPEDGPFPRSDAPPTSVEDAEARAMVALDVLRDLGGVPSVSGDPLLNALARAEATRLRDGGEPDAGRLQRVRATGFPEGRVAEVTCVGDTVQTCLDSLFWSPDSRSLMLNVVFRTVGVGAALDNGNVRLVIDLAEGSGLP